MYQVYEYDFLQIVGIAYLELFYKEQAADIASERSSDGLQRYPRLCAG